MRQDIGDISSYMNLKKLYEESLDDSLEDENSFFYFCSYVPVEVIHASGFRPVRLNVNLDTFFLSDEVTPKYLCPYLKSVIELFLKKNLKRKNIIFTDGCDSSRRVFEIFKELGFVDKFYYLKIPFNENPIDIEFFKDEIEKLYLLLNGKIDKEKLVNSINLYNSGKKKLKKLISSLQNDSLSKNYLNYIFQTIGIEDFLNQEFKFDN
ncbi:MAG TPA: 2-hydroxyacyl-CoA dehydratase family protein, partial [Caldisericia bacterium]|nr:2-hydroxyacyl-CoA dehydratase family protein [Caldisericia bacterium]